MPININDLLEIFPKEYTSTNSKKFQEPFRKIGKIKSPQGLKGEVFVILFAKESDILFELNSLYLIYESSQNENLLLKVDILNVKPHKDGFILKLDLINNRNKSEICKNIEFCVNKNELVSKQGESIYLTELEGFLIQIDNEKRLGPIYRFSSNGAQDLLIVKGKNNTDIEIPFVDVFVRNIDYENKIIHMELPDGLLEINEVIGKNSYNDEN